MFIFDPRPPVIGNFIQWAFRCEWCGKYYHTFFITRENKRTFKCACGNHPTSRYKQQLSTLN